MTTFWGALKVEMAAVVGVPDVEIAAFVAALEDDLERCGAET